nr:hypothetical protein [Bradyrhizobium yuanmingense]
MEDFENLGASWKRSRQRTRLNRVLHGKEGQGRLRFFSVAQRASWWSVYRDGDTLRKLSIQIASDSLHKSEVY